MADPVRFVIIEDEAPIRRFLKASLGPEEAEWHEAETAAQGIKLVAQRNPAVVLLDLGLPDQDGLDVLRSLREWTEVPVIVLPASVGAGCRGRRLHHEAVFCRRADGASPRGFASRGTGEARNGACL